MKYKLQLNLLLVRIKKSDEYSGTYKSEFRERPREFNTFRTLYQEETAETYFTSSCECMAEHSQRRILKTPQNYNEQSSCEAP